MGDILGASLVGGKAEAQVEKMTAKKQNSGKTLEKHLERIYEEKSTKNMAGLYMSWITTPKPVNQTTEDFATEWNATRAVIEKNMNWEQMRCYIFMHLLGEQNRQFYHIETSRDGPLDIDAVQ